MANKKFNKFDTFVDPALQDDFDYPDRNGGGNERNFFAKNKDRKTKGQKEFRRNRRNAKESFLG